MGDEVVIPPSFTSTSPLGPQEAEVKEGKLKSGQSVVPGETPLTQEQQSKAKQIIEAAKPETETPRQITAKTEAKPEVKQQQEKVTAATARPRAHEAPELGQRTEVKVGETKRMGALTMTEVEETVSSRSEASQKKMIERGADLRTAQGPKAHMHALKSQACILGAVAHSDHVALEGITRGPNGEAKAMNPKQQFQAMTKCFQDVANGAKLDNPEDGKLLNFLGGLMNKGFNGGIGAFQGYKDPSWNKDWNKFSADAAEEGKPFKYDSPETTTWKEANVSVDELKQMFPGRSDADYKKMADRPIERGQYEELKKNPALQAKVDSCVNQKNAENHKNNEKLLKEFQAMTAFYSAHGEAHFTPAESRHQAGVELAAAQLACTYGQLVHDAVLESRMPSGRSLLMPEMIRNGIIKDAKEFEDIAGFEKQMRNNPLLAEASNETIRKEILGKLKSGAKRDEMVNILKGQLSSLNTGDPKLTDEQISKLADKLADRFANGVSGMKFNIDKSGARGRTAAMRAAKLLVKSIVTSLVGARGVKNSFSIMPNREDDARASQWAADTLGKDDAKVKGFLTAVGEKNQNILFHAGSPTGILRLGTGLDSNFKELALNPGRFLRDEIKGMQSQDPAEARLLKALSDELPKAEMNGQLRNVLAGKKQPDGSHSGGIEVTFNGATKQTMQLGDFAEMNSVASIMNQNNLRTICSISGTTVDASIGLSLVLGQDGMRELLQPLLKFAENPSDPSPLNTPEGQKFKETFTSIAFFMQSGQYHTAAEVLGGLFMAARGLQTSTDEARKDNINIPKTYQMFTNLMQAFSAHPENFFAVNDADKAKITSPENLQIATQQLAMGQQARFVETQRAAH